MKITERKRPLREVRKDTMVPGVIYGKSITSTPIEAPLGDVLEAFKRHGKTMTFEVTLKRKKHQVYFKHIQRKILKPDEIIHFELHRLAKDETVIAQIPIQIKGKEMLEKSRYFVQQNLSSVEAEYAPGKGVSHIDVDVSHMTVSDTYYVKDLLEIPDVSLKNDPETLILSIKEGVMLTEETPDEDPVEASKAAQEPIFDSSDNPS
mgnify:CR=1 FL=1